MNHALRVMLIEDDADTRANVRDILELDEHEVTAAATWADATARPGWERQTDVLLLDRRLPDATADDLVPHVRAAAPSVAIVVVTGSQDLEGAIACLRQGADDYLLKPINAEMLRRSLARIAERRRLANEKEEAEASLAALVASSNDAIISQDLQGRVLTWNAAAERIYGYPAEEMMGQSAVRLLVPPERHEERDAVLRRVRAGEPVANFETVRLRRDGARVDVAVTYSPLRDQKGQIVGVSSSARDVTEQKRTQRALRQSEQQLQAIFNLAAVGIAQLTLDGRYLNVNPRYTRITGYSREELLSRNFRDLCHGDDLADVQQLIERLKAGSATSLEVENRHHHKDGSLRWAQMAISLVRDDADEPQYLVAAVQDITDRKEAEQEMQELNAALAERTTLAEQRAAQLRTLARELTQAEQQERRRLAQVLHDHLQQLLVAARLRLSLLAQQMGNGPLQEDVAQIDQLVDDSIEASRSLTAELAPPALNHGGFDTALEWIGLWMQQKHGLRVSVRADAHAEPKEQELRVLLFDIVRELLFNVVKYAGVNTASVTMTRTEEGMLQIVVEDQGAGFDPARLERSPYQLSGGYGLFNAKQRLKLLGGQLALDSTPGAGTRVILLAPFRSEAPAEIPLPATQAAGARDAGAFSGTGAGVPAR